MDCLNRAGLGQYAGAFADCGYTDFSSVISKSEENWDQVGGGGRYYFSPLLWKKVSKNCFPLEETGSVFLVLVEGL